MLPETGYALQGGLHKYLSENAQIFETQEYEP